MPIKIPNNLPAFSTLVNENIFVMADEKASRQDIRPLKVAIVNLMPTKIVTETQLLRLLSNTPLQIEIVLLHPATHISKNVSAEYLNNFYKTFDENGNPQSEKHLAGASCKLLHHLQSDKGAVF